MSFNQIARTLGINPRSVKKAVGSLIRKGCLKRIERGYSRAASNVYGLGDVWRIEYSD